MLQTSSKNISLNRCQTQGGPLVIIKATFIHQRLIFNQLRNQSYFRLSSRAFHPSSDNPQPIPTPTALQGELVTHSETSQRHSPGRLPGCCGRRQQTACDEDKMGKPTSCSLQHHSLPIQLQRLELTALSTALLANNTTAALWGKLLYKAHL